MTQFTDLGLDKALLKSLAAEGYEKPTPIQAQAIPGVMAGRDLLGIAQTGTGKTAAFALPILHRLAADRKPAPRRGCRALVLSPTRELATQIADSFRTYGKHLGLSVAVIFGGVKYGPQMRALAAGIDILVATPGRLLDHLGEKSASLGATEIFVLDEADQMLDLGFLVPIRKIVAHMPKNRQNLFFSATMPTEIGRLAGDLLNDPLKVSVAPQATTVERVNQQVVFVDKGADDGLRPGNRLFVIRRGDTWRDSMRMTKRIGRQRMRVEDPEWVRTEPIPIIGEDDEFPEEVVAELRVVRTQPKTAVAVVMESKLELEPGDRALARVGY